MSPDPGSTEDREPEADPGSVADAELVGASDPGVDASYAASLSRREVERIEGEQAPEAPGASGASSPSIRSTSRRLSSAA